MTSADRLLVASFDGRSVELDCETDWIADEVRLRLGNLLTGRTPDPIVLRARCGEPAPQCAEYSDSAGAYAVGTPAHVFAHLRKAVTRAFLGARPDLLWLHASAAAIDGCAVVFAGPAGAGKSTLATELVARTWHLLADDSVPILTDTLLAMPLPFTPEPRTKLAAASSGKLLSRDKVPFRVPPTRVASAPVPVNAVVLPAYAPRMRARPALSLLTPAAALARLAELSVATEGKIRILRQLHHVTESVPCFEMRYRDASAAGELVAFRFAGS